MSYLVLSDATKQNLEQERSRLMSDRAKIVSDIETSVRAEIDQTLKTLNALLSEAPVEVVPADDIVETVTELLEQPTTETSTKATRTFEPKATRKTGTKKSEAKEASKSSQAFDAKALKRQFKGMDLKAAIVQILQQDPTKEYETDALIDALYDKFDTSELPKARKTLGATLMHQRLAGVVEKLGDKSPRYKLGQSAVSA